MIILNSIYNINSKLKKFPGLREKIRKQSEGFGLEVSEL
jgi:hypothetical protein